MGKNRTVTNVETKHNLSQFLYCNAILVTVLCINNSDSIKFMESAYHMDS